MAPIHRIGLGRAEILYISGLTAWTLIVVEALILTPLLFVFAETLPKDLFRTHTDHWTYRLSGAVVAARWIFMCIGLLPTVHLAGALAARLLGGTTEGTVSARQRISQLIKEGVGTGVLTEAQTTLVDRALAMRNRTVATEMVPWHRVVTVSLTADHETRAARFRRGEHTRIPVVDEAGRAVGVLSVIDAMLQADRPTSELMTSPVTFRATTPVREALQSMRAGHQPMATVLGPDHDRPVGLITLKDLVEPITGELAVW